MQEELVSPRQSEPPSGRAARVRAWKSVGDLSRAENLFLVCRFEESLALYISRLGRLRRSTGAPAAPGSTALPALRHYCTEPGAASDSPPGDACECRRIVAPIVKLLAELKRVDEILPFLHTFYYMVPLIPPPVLLAVMQVYVRLDQLEDARCLALDFFSTSVRRRRHAISPPPVTPSEQHEDELALVEIVRLLVFAVLAPLRRFDEARDFLARSDAFGTGVKDLLLAELALIERSSQRSAAASTPGTACRQSPFVESPAAKPAAKQLIADDQFGVLAAVLPSRLADRLLPWLHASRRWLVVLLALTALALLARYLLHRGVWRLPKSLRKSLAAFLRLFVGHRPH